MILLIDVGNTHIKWLVTVGSPLNKSNKSTAHPLGDLATLALTWQKIMRPQTIAIASVAPTALTKQLIAIAKKIWPDITITIAQTCAYACGVTNAYANYEHLGVDRWLALLALNRYHCLPAVIVDCGSAITLDVLAINGVHQGGLIAPGLMMMQQALHQTTHISYPANAVQTQDNLLGKATSSCMAKGALMAAVGLIEKTYQQLDSSYSLIMTGGDAQIITQHLAIDAVIDAHIVLQGRALLIEKKAKLKPNFTAR